MRTSDSGKDGWAIADSGGAIPVVNELVVGVC